MRLFLLFLLSLCPTYRVLCGLALLRLLFLLPLLLPLSLQLKISSSFLFLFCILFSHHRFYFLFSVFFVIIITFFLLLPYFFLFFLFFFFILWLNIICLLFHLIFLPLFPFHFSLPYRAFGNFYSTYNLL